RQMRGLELLFSPPAAPPPPPPPCRWATTVVEPANKTIPNISPAKPDADRRKPDTMTKDTTCLNTAGRRLPSWNIAQISKNTLRVEQDLQDTRGDKSSDAGALKLVICRWSNGVCGGGQTSLPAELHSLCYPGTPSARTKNA